MTQKGAAWECLSPSLYLLMLTLSRSCLGSASEQTLGLVILGFVSLRLVNLGINVTLGFVSLGLISVGFIFSRGSFPLLLFLHWLAIVRI